MLYKAYRFDFFFRSKSWVDACNRPDLLDKLHTLHKSHYICDAHFSPRMMKKGKRQLLRKDAVPLKFVSSTVANEAVAGPSCSTTKTSLEQSASILCSLLEPSTSSNKSSEQTSSIRSPTRYVQTPQALTSRTPRKEKLKQINNELQLKITALSKENQTLLTKCADLEKKCQEVTNQTVTLEQYKTFTYSLCPSKELAEFIIVQISESMKSAKGRRYSDEFKLKCLSLYFAGPKVYKTILTKLFYLPGPQALTKLVRGITISPGLEVPNVFRTLKIKADSFNEMDRYCVLCVDEMSIKANFFFNISADYVVGVEDSGHGKRLFKPARTATVLLVRGMFSNWKQPLAYFFYNSTCPGIELKHIVLDAIQKLKNIGFIVIATVCDMGSNNIQLNKNLQITPERPYFIFDDQKIFYIFDTPHLIKALRNMLLKHDFLVSNEIVSWKHIMQFYNIDKSLVTRSAPKLTDSHIFPSNFEKMKVKYASHVFSATVSAALNVYVDIGQLPEAARATANFIDKIDKLFDLLNSSKTSGSKKYNLAFRGLDFQITFLHEMLLILEGLRVFNNQSKDVSGQMKFITGFKISINSIIHLWDFLKSKNVTFLFTRRLNQDPLENLFGIIRQQNSNCPNPTAIQFQRSFRKMFCVRLLNSGTQNCENDMDNLLLRVSDVIKDNTSLPDIAPSRSCTTSLPKIDNSYQTESTLDANFKRYFAGYLMKKCLNVHSCPICIVYAKAYHALDDTSLFCYYKAYENANLDSFGNLNMPHNDFVKFISLLEVIFQLNFENISIQMNVIKLFESICKSTTFSHPCEKFPLSYLIKLFGRVRLFYTLKTINRKFKTVKDKKIIIWKNK